MWEQTAFNLSTGERRASGRSCGKDGKDQFALRNSISFLRSLAHRRAARLHTEISCNFVLVQNLMLSLNM